VKEAKELALALSEKRKAAALKLEQLVIKELKDLGMAGTVFKISIKRETSPDGDIESDNNKYILYPHGIDRIEFLLSANEGEDLRQLRKVASGGEMSRIMLALKNVIQSADIVETLIFDEVDTGISGKTAEIVGRKLRNLSKDRQVLLITHLPQIAAMSDTHFLVQKGKSEGRVTTLVKNLSDKEKVREVARMLAGEEITDLSIKHAEEMIERALAN
jgi:DNA repair protein RecN (Recombination protein N)